MAKDHLKIFDTTLRDGEQSPGAAMTREEKLRIARQLEMLHVDVIEAGFPAASPGDFESVKAVAAAIKESTVCGLARANEKDVRRAGEAIKPARSGRIHTFIATSPIHMEKKLRMQPDQVVDAAVAAVKLALQYTDDVEFSAEDAVRSEFDFLCRVFDAVIKAGATTINVPDTVGYSIPELWGERIRQLIEGVPNSDKVVWSTHCHNDLGLAVANSLSAVLAGARQVECTINGLGERADSARQLLESAQIQVDEARRELQALRDGLELDPERLAEVESRLSTIYTLARKHRVAPAELHRLQQEMSSEAAGLDVSDARIEALEEGLQALEAAWVALAAQLSKARTATARSISKQVQEQLAFLGMGSCRFAVAIRPLADKGPSPAGAEQIEFLVATNPGAEPGPLARIASGGELSRISLAIQVIIASRATTPTVIFDEVDVGIGGATADAVGSLLQTLGQRIQVVCVTHLPQVAARGAQHLLASKSSNGESTSAALTPLAADERVEELARMLGGKTVTKKTQEHAREMLESATL